MHAETSIADWLFSWSMCPVRVKKFCGAVQGLGLLTMSRVSDFGCMRSTAGNCASPPHQRRLQQRLNEAMEQHDQETPGGRVDGAA